MSAVPLGSNASTRTTIAIPIAVSMEAIVMPCSQNSVLIFSANETSLSIVCLKLVIWLVSLPFRRSMLSCLTFRSSFSLAILRLMSSRMSSSYPGLSQIAASLCFSRSMLCCNSAFLVISTFSEPRMLLSCLSRPIHAWAMFPARLSPPCFSLHSPELYVV